MHVRTMDCSIIRHKELRRQLEKGLNHIPLQPTHLQPVVTALTDGFHQLVALLRGKGHTFLDSWLDKAKRDLIEHCWFSLKTAAKRNRRKQIHAASILNDLDAMDEVQWLFQHLFIVGLDKGC